MKINGRKLILLFGITLAAAVAVLFLRGVVKAQGPKDVLRCASDACFVSGVVMAVIGGLVWTADQGVADGLTYGFSRFFTRRGPGYEDRRESYSEYRERKHAKKLHVAEFLISGGVFIALALLLLIPYEML